MSLDSNASASAQVDRASIEQQFLDAMASRSVNLDTASRGGPHPIADGKLHRADALGKRKKRNGHIWYTLYPDHPASGAFGDFQLGVDDTWSAVGDIKKLTREEKAELARRMEETRRQRAEDSAKLHAAAAAAAALIMKGTAKPAPHSPYLARKRLPVFPGLRVMASNVNYVIEDGEEPRLAKKGNLVVPIYSPDKVLVGVQLIWPDGTKRFVKGTPKEGNYHSIGKAPEEPAKFDGLVYIAEGYATAARIHEATDGLVFAAFDAGNLKPVAVNLRKKFKRAKFVFCADNDRFTKNADGTMNPGVTKAKDAAETVKGIVAIPQFADDEDKATDFDDLAILRGLNAVKATLDEAISPPPPVSEGVRPTSAPLEIAAFKSATPAEIRNLNIAGFSLESASPTLLAKTVIDILRRNYGDVVHDEGAVHVFHRTHWHRVDDKRDLGPLIAKFDGEPAGRRSISMTPKLRKDVVSEIEIELLRFQSDDGFFASAPIGIAVANGFVRFDDGRVTLEQSHRPDQRARWKLDAECDPSLAGMPATDTLLHRLVYGVFAGDDDQQAKVALIGEMLGAAVSGQATKLANPLATFLIGETAENGKSQILALFRALLPPGATISLAPAYLSDEKHRVRLIGCLANVVDEVDGRAIDSAEFKKAVLGERLVGRDVYSPAIEFTPKALHVFGCNALPRFTNGFDRGIRRRVMPIAFNRTIPVAERIPQIAQRIVKDEAAALLSFAAHGALRLSRAGQFTMPPSSAVRRAEWGRSDPVKEWAERHLVPLNRKPVDGWPRRMEAYAAYRAWALAEGFSHLRIVEPDAFWLALKTVPDLRFSTINGYAVVYAEVLKQPARTDGNYEDHESR